MSLEVNKQFIVENIQMFDTNDLHLMAAAIDVELQTRKEENEIVALKDVICVQANKLASGPNQGFGALHACWEAIQNITTGAPQYTLKEKDELMKNVQEFIGGYSSNISYHPDPNGKYNEFHLVEGWQSLKPASNPLESMSEAVSVRYKLSCTFTPGGRNNACVASLSFALCAPINYLHKRRCYDYDYAMLDVDCANRTMELSAPSRYCQNYPAVIYRRHEKPLHKAVYRAADELGFEFV